MRLWAERSRSDNGSAENGPDERGRAGKSMLTWRLLVFGLGLSMLIGGIFRDDVLQLWRRATQLCLGCIGIG